MSASTSIKNKTIRVCVLSPSYENSDSATKEWDSILATPKHFFPDDFVEVTTDENAVEVHTRYVFDYVELEKPTSYRSIRGLVKSNKYDVFFNLCDGAKDEDRAGEEVVRSLEEFNVPYTGATSKYFELSKPDMKMMAHYCKVPTARHAVLDASDLLPLLDGEGGEDGKRLSAPISPHPEGASAAVAAATSATSADAADDADNSAAVRYSPEAVAAMDDAAIAAVTMRLEAKCAHLRFPVIVKHVSGYASIGMTRENKCETMEALKKRAAIFIAEFDFALVEEFIVGDEATVLACADDSAEGGIRVFHPVMVNFPEGNDFKHFELKWESYEGMEWQLVPESDPSLAQILEVGRRSFKEMMGGVGYGRCDLRINRERNEVVFLEINPNCGIMYPPGQEGSADFILQMEGTMLQQREAEKKKKDGEVIDPASFDKLKGQRDFAILQIKNAISRCERTKPLWYRSFDGVREFHLRAARDIKKGTIVFNDEGRSVRLFTRPYVESTWSEEDKEQFVENAWPIGVTAASSSSSSAAAGPSSSLSALPSSYANHHYFAVWDIDPANWRTFNHSEAAHANLVFGPNRSLNVVAARDIRKGEELTMNYELLKSEHMPQPKKEKRA